MLAAAILLLSSCSRQRKESREDLRSDLTAATSLATESESFLGYALQGRSTSNYAEAHLSYLSEEAQHDAEQLQRAKPEADIAAQFERSRTQIQTLQTQIEAARQALHDSAALQQAKEDIADTRKALAQIQASL